MHRHRHFKSSIIVLYMYEKPQILRTFCTHFTWGFHRKNSSSLNLYKFFPPQTKPNITHLLLVYLLMIACFAVQMNVFLLFGPTLIMSPSSAGLYTVTDCSPSVTKLTIYPPSNPVCEWKWTPIGPLDRNNLFGGSLKQTIPCIVLQYIQIS